MDEYETFFRKRGSSAAEHRTRRDRSMLKDAEDGTNLPAVVSFGIGGRFAQARLPSTWGS